MSNNLNKDPVNSFGCSIAAEEVRLERARLFFMGKNYKEIRESRDTNGYIHADSAVKNVAAECIDGKPIGARCAAYWEANVNVHIEKGIITKVVSFG